MNWIFVSCILMFSSVGLYLTLRSINRYETPLAIRSLVMFASPLPFLFGYAYLYGIPLLIEIKYIGILFLSAIFLSWLSNIASLKSLDNAPNPGYPLIIGKSYVVYTTIFAVLFFGDDLSVTKFIAIGAIVFFVGLIALSKKRKKQEGIQKPWLGYAIFTFFAWGNLALVLSYILDQGISSVVVNFYLLGFVSLLIIGEILLNSKMYTPRSRSEVLHLGAIAFFFTIFQQSGVYGYSVAPNPGYINAANIASIALTAVFAKYVFGDELNTISTIGIVGVTIGLFFLFI